ncbi:hypothetical protein DFH29DRAFT_1037980 [Suillus ampliporus]|nr:hypothetical protein DFH29DRAFT_1037980 [Suillus ampliporus]
MAGDKFAVHYGTDPLACFHLAEALAPAVGSAPEEFTLKDVVDVCRTQFSRWCISVCKVLRSQRPCYPSPLIIRCFVGDALSLCQALDYYNTTKSTSTPFVVAPWKHSRITLDPDAYGTRTQSPAPTTFNVIDTSNLLDHVGVLNILTITSPILRRTPSATLYTEGLAVSSSEATLLQQLCGDIATLGLLLGLIPVSFVSQFTNRSNMHELIVREAQQHTTQNHERLDAPPRGRDGALPYLGAQTQLRISRARYHPSNVRPRRDFYLFLRRRGGDRGICEEIPDASIACALFDEGSD